MSYTLEDYETFLKNQHTEDLLAGEGFFDIITGRGIYNIEEGDNYLSHPDVIIEPENNNCVRFSYYLARDRDDRQQYCYDCILKPSDNNVEKMTLCVITKERGEEYYIKRNFKNISSFDELIDIILQQVYHMLWAYDDDKKFKCWYKSEYIEDIVCELEEELLKVDKDVHYYDVVVPVTNMLMLGKYDWNLDADIINLIIKNT